MTLSVLWIIVSTQLEVEEPISLIEQANQILRLLLVRGVPELPRAHSPAKFPGAFGTGLTVIETDCVTGTAPVNAFVAVFDAADSTPEALT
jgi:hypothetical protein